MTSLGFYFGLIFLFWRLFWHLVAFFCAYVVYVRMQFLISVFLIVAISGTWIFNWQTFTEKNQVHLDVREVKTTDTRSLEQKHSQRVLLQEQDLDKSINNHLELANDRRINSLQVWLNLANLYQARQDANNVQKNLGLATQIDPRIRPTDD